VINQIAELV